MRDADVGPQERGFEIDGVAYLPAEDPLADVRRAYELSPPMSLWNRDGIPWNMAPAPRRLHRCAPWTMSLSLMRCSCGAVASTLGPWMEKNSRRDPWWRCGRTKS